MLQRQGSARRLHTAAAADPTPAIYDYGVRSRVMTCDGHPGTVLAVAEGPYPGTESYEVRLDGGLGGGQYGVGQLQPLAAGQATGTAAADYPELAQVLVEHPDPARGVSARTAARGGCTECGGGLGSSAFPSCSACSSYTHHGNCCPRTESTPGMDDVVRNIDALHRGLQLRLPDDLHHFANDPEGDRSAQAHSLVDHIARTGDEAHAHGLGLSWTDDPDFARDYAYGRPGTTSVILHAKPPAPEHVENDRAALADYPGSPARYQGKDWPEIPLKRDAPVHLTGLSWRTDGDGPRWRHHDFGDTGAPHHAATDRTERTPTEQSWWSTYDDPDPTRSASAHLASAEMSLGETIVPDRIPGPGPTKARSPMDNPASSGWASGPDPDQWSAAPLYPLDSRVGQALTADGAEATLHDEPEAALPSTDGQINADDADPEALNPMGFNAVHTAMPSLNHPAPAGFHTRTFGEDGKELTHDELSREHQLDPDWCSEDGVCDGFKERVIKGYDPSHPLHPEPVSALHYRLSRCGHKAVVGGVGTDEGARGHGYASALMDELYDRHPDAEIDHGLRTDDGLKWWAQYDDPDPRRSVGGGPLYAPRRVFARANSTDPEEPIPQDFTAVLAAMHAANPDMDPRRSSAGRADGDIAAAAQAHLAGLGKTAAYAFTPGQRRELIEEAPEALAANSDRLDLTGTHYADMQQMMGDDEEDDGSWLV